MRRRLLVPALASALLLNGCATRSPESQLVDSYDALVAQANARDVNGLRDAVDAFVDLVHREEGDSLTAQEARRLIDLANAVKRNAAKVDPPATPSPEPAPTQEPAPTKEPEKKKEDEDKDEGKGEDKNKGKDEEEGNGGESSPPTSEPQPTIEVTVGAAEARRSPTAVASPSAATNQPQAPSRAPAA